MTSRRAEPVRRDRPATCSLQPCKRPVCTETFQIYTFVPASALGFEMGKHVYPYFGLSLTQTGTPPAPKWLILNAGGAKVTTSRALSAGEFLNTLTFTFTIGNDGFYFPRSLHEGRRGHGRPRAAGRTAAAPARSRRTSPTWASRRISATPVSRRSTSDASL